MSDLVGCQSLVSAADFGRVPALMEDAERSGIPHLLNEINAGEVFYIDRERQAARRHHG